MRTKRIAAFVAVAALAFPAIALPFIDEDQVNVKTTGEVMGTLSDGRVVVQTKGGVVVLSPSEVSAISTPTPSPSPSPSPSPTASPSPLPSPSPSPTAGKNCMPNPSACGFPDLGTAGVIPGTSLSAVSGTVTLSQDNQVYENKVVSGSIVVTGRNVTIRNVKVVNRAQYYVISVKPGGSWEGDNAGLMLDHVEIDLGGATDVKGVAFDGYTLRNSFIHNGSDCAHFEVNVVIEDSLCAVGPDTNGDAWPDSAGFCTGTDHFDGFQSDGGHDDTIRHNTIRNPCRQVSDILLSSNTLPISNVTVTNNLLAGGGFPLYCAGSNDRSRVSNIAATNNRFAKTYYPLSGYWGTTAYCEFASVFASNVWDDTGAAISG
jgi:hypothetical protein